MAPKPIEEKKQPLNKEEVRMNLQLMRGEVPQVYKDLLLRFKVADIFLKQGGSKMTRLTDVNNYLSLSDIKMSFLEKHVQQIVFLYAFEEKTDEEVAEEYEINSIFSELSLLVTKLNETMLPRMLQLIVVSIPYTSQSSKSRVVVSPRVHT